MSNYYANQIIVKKHHFQEILNQFRTDQTDFDLSRVIPCPQSLPSYNRELLVALAYFFTENSDSVPMDHILDGLENHIEDPEDIEDLAGEYNPTNANEPMLNHLGSIALQNLKNYGVFFLDDWKIKSWGSCKIEGVRVEGRKVTIYSSESILGFAAMWSKASGLDLDFACIDSGCHHGITAELRAGVCLNVRRDDPTDMRTMCKKLLGYTEDELV